MKPRALCNVSSLTAVVLLAGCSDTTQTARTSAVITIEAAGATFPARLYKTWIDEYQNVDPQVKVNYADVGSGEGIERFLAGTVDVGASDAALTDEQIQSVERGVVLVPERWAAV